MKGRFRRGLMRWMARAINSLPVPVSPRIKTVASVGATTSTCPIIRLRAQAWDRIARGRPKTGGRGDLPQDLAGGERGILPRGRDRDPRDPDVLRPAVQDPDELDVAELLRDDCREPASRVRRP